MLTAFLSQQAAGTMNWMGSCGTHACIGMSSSMQIGQLYAGHLEVSNEFYKLILYLQSQFSFDQ